MRIMVYWRSFFGAPVYGIHDKVRDAGMIARLILAMTWLAMWALHAFAW